MAWRKARFGLSDMIPAMIASLRHFLGWLVSAFRSGEALVLESLALHQQLLALHAQRPRRRLTAMHKLFWVALRTFWCELQKLGFDVSERSVSRWIRRAPRDPDSVKRWLTFLRNHRSHCWDGLLHRPNAHVRYSVLLFRPRPRPAEDHAFQCDGVGAAIPHCNRKSNTVTKMSRKLRKTAANVKQMEANEGENGLWGFVPTC
jgi:hypothetical protein